jgi:hypothetical protein
MVKAILHRLKAQTRRVIKSMPDEPPFAGTARKLFDYLEPEDRWCWWRDDGSAIFKPFGKKIRCPYGKVGDVLYVRETFKSFNDGDTFYKADHNGIPVHADDDANSWKWTPSIHMPKEHARIWLEITDIRVERVQDISRADATEEGIPNAAYAVNSVESFKYLWDSINGCRVECSWESNPYCWCISFKVKEKDYGNAE